MVPFWSKIGVTSLSTNEFWCPIVENDATSRGVPFLQVKPNETLLGGLIFVEMWRVDISRFSGKIPTKPCLGADFEQGFETNPLCFILFRNFFIFISKNSHEIFWPQSAKLAIAPFKSEIDWKLTILDSRGEKSTFPPPSPHQWTLAL